jgi:methylglyoxal reductase
MGGESVWGESDDNESIKTINRAYDLGINFFDTAPVYGFGRSERILGKAIAERRKDFVISSKCGLVWDKEGSLLYSRDGYDVRRNLTADNIKREIDISLGRLNTDYIDVYYTHWQSVPDFPVPISETMGALTEIKKAGKIRSIGASNVSLEQIKEYMKYGQLDIIQDRFSMLDQHSFKEVNDFCLNNNISFQAYSPFERGLLTGAVGRDFKINPGDARSNIKWYRDDLREKILEMLEGFSPLCKKYECSLASLIVACTLAQAPNVNVDAGSRRVKAIEENARGGEIILTNEDKNMMNEAINNILSMD